MAGTSGLNAQRNQNSATASLTPGQRNMANRAQLSGPGARGPPPPPRDVGATNSIGKLSVNHIHTHSTHRHTPTHIRPVTFQSPFTKN